MRQGVGVSVQRLHADHRCGFRHSIKAGGTGGTEMQTRRVPDLTAAESDSSTCELEYVSLAVMDTVG